MPLLQNSRILYAFSRKLSIRLLQSAALCVTLSLAVNGKITQSGSKRTGVTGCKPPESCGVWFARELRPIPGVSGALSPLKSAAALPIRPITARKPWPGRGSAPKIGGTAEARLSSYCVLRNAQRFMDGGLFFYPARCAE